MLSSHALAHQPARSFDSLSFNDNELEGDLPAFAEMLYLRRGLAQAGGKLPLFDDLGREYDARTIRACIRAGWAEPWFANPLKPDWLVCKLTESGRAALAD